MLFSIEDFSKLRPISHIIWDVDGPITEKDKIEPSVAAKIINLALDDICHSFITGRDAKWLKNNLIRPMQDYYSFPIAHKKFTFYAEVGCIQMELRASKKVNWTLHPDIAEHPLVDKEKKIRPALQDCVYDPEKSIREYKAGETIDELSEEVVYDANDKGWVFNIKEKTRYFNYIWGTKEAIVTWEKVRDSKGSVADFNQQPFVKEAENIIKEKGFEKDIAVEEIGTAINILPVIKGRTLGKSWAAGIALERIWNEELGGKTGSLESVVEKTIAIGDGRADFGFTAPDFGKKTSGGHVNFIFVGGKHDIPKPHDSDRKLIENMVIRATGLGVMQFHYDPISPAIYMEPAKGARVVSEVLDFLKLQGYFRSFRQP